MRDGVVCIGRGWLTVVYRIGRITRGLLLSLAEKVDVVEPIKKFTDALKDVPGVGEVYNVGLELWKPASGAVYDLVWNQWCVGHLTDLQLVAYLRRCGEALRREEGGKVVGWIVVKENLTNEEDVYDETDSSVTRYVYPLFIWRYSTPLHFVDGSESAKLTRIIGRKGNSKSYLRKLG